MKPLEDRAVKEMGSLFPYVTNEDLFGDGRREDLYKVFAISNFDHWLSEDKASRLIISYAAYKSPDEVPQAYFEAERRHLNLFGDVYKLCTVYNFVENEAGSGTFYEFESFEEFMQVCKNSLRERSFITLCIPDWRLVISGSHDLTSIVHYTADSVIDDLVKLVEGNGLHALWPGENQRGQEESYPAAP